jgi:hypothetical protein
LVAVSTRNSTFACVQDDDDDDEPGQSVFGKMKDKFTAKVTKGKDVPSAPAPSAPTRSMPSYVPTPVPSDVPVQVPKLTSAPASVVAVQNPAPTPALAPAPIAIAASSSAPSVISKSKEARLAELIDGLGLGLPGVAAPFPACFQSVSR